jgi:maleate cis-trans isomerase
MTFTSWRGVVGVIKPTMRPGSLEEFIRLLPDGIGVIPLFLNIHEGTESEFRAVLDAVERKVEELAGLKVDVIHPEGAPPFMVQGFAGERDIVKRWEDKFGVPIVTAPQTQVEAMRAMDVESIVGVTYFEGEINDIFARYFRDAGFDVQAMEGISVPFTEVGRLSSQEVYAHSKRAFLKHPDADAIYMLGSGWRVLDIIETLEDDLEVPVIHAVPARVWSIQRRLHVNQPVPGYGRLLFEMPPLLRD